MEIAVAANGTGLESPVSPAFGQCPTLVFVDTDTMRFEAMVNPESGDLRGTGIQVAEFILERGVQAVVTGNVGPNAFRALQASGVPVYLCRGRTVWEAIEAYKAGQLQTVEEANVPTHSGKELAGSGVGSGLNAQSRTWGPIPPVPSAPFASREEETTVLKETARELRNRLAQVLGRLDQLENES